MTVADLQKYLQALADAMTAGNSPAARSLTDAADRLGKFSHLGIAEFSEFLRNAWEYKTTGIIPVPAVPAPPAPPDPTQSNPKVEKIIARVKELYDEAITPEFNSVAAERQIKAIETQSRDILDAVAAGCGFKQKYRNKGEIIKALLNYVIGRKGSFERAGA